MKLSLSEYCVADLLHRNPKISVKRIATNFHMTQENVDKIIRRLVLMNFVMIDSETNKLVVSDLWRQGIKETPKLPVLNDNGEKEYSIDHKFKMKVLEIKPGYQWDGQNGKVAKFLITKFRARHKLKHNLEATDEQIIEAFSEFIRLLPKKRWPVWDLKKLNTDFNVIIDEIKREQSGLSQGRIADNQANILSALALLNKDENS